MLSGVLLVMLVLSKSKTSRKVKSESNLCANFQKDLITLRAIHVHEITQYSSSTKVKMVCTCIDNLTFGSKEQIHARLP